MTLITSPRSERELWGDQSLDHLLMSGYSAVARCPTGKASALTTKKENKLLLRHRPWGPDRGDGGGKALKISVQREQKRVMNSMTTRTMRQEKTTAKAEQCLQDTEVVNHRMLLPYGSMLALASNHDYTPTHQSPPHRAHSQPEGGWSGRRLPCEKAEAKGARSGKSLRVYLGVT